MKRNKNGLEHLASARDNIIMCVGPIQNMEMKNRIALMPLN